MNYNLIVEMINIKIKKVIMTMIKRVIMKVRIN